MKTKRILAVLLTLTMIIGMFPVIANAQTDEALYGESADALGGSGALAGAFSSSSAEYIKLQSNVTITSMLELWEGEKTVDLNGYTITAEGCNAFHIFGSTLNLIDTSAGTKGKVVSSVTAIYLDYNGALNIGNSIENNGGFTIETDASSPAIYVAGNSLGVNVYQPFTAIGTDVAIENMGNFNGNNIPFAFEGRISNGGTISNLNATGYAEQNSTINIAAGNLHITGGTYKSKKMYGLYMLGGEVKLEGGTFESENSTTEAIYIDSSAGATYADLLGDGYYYTDGESDTEITSEETLASANKLTVVKGTPEPPTGSVASVTTAGGETTYYTDFNAAISAAQNSGGSTLTLLDDKNGSCKAINWGTFTIDLNGKTWDFGNGTHLDLSRSNVIITDNSAEEKGKIVIEDNFLDQLMSSTKLEIAGGTIETRGNYVVVETGGNGRKRKNSGCRVYPFGR